jgi:DNA-binding XRE family transcriptional regulator
MAKKKKPKRESTFGDNNNHHKDELTDEVIDQIDWFREKVIRLRKAAGLTQTELGERLGVTKWRVSHIENGRSVPSTITQFRLLKCLKINPSDFFSDCPTFSKHA